MPESGRSEDWTLSTQHEYFLRLLEELDKRYEQRFTSQERAILAALAAVKEATEKAEQSNDKRFDSTNEWRRTVSDLIASMSARGQGIKDGWGYLVGAIGITIAIIALFRKS